MVPALTKIEDRLIKEEKYDNNNNEIMHKMQFNHQRDCDLDHLARSEQGVEEAREEQMCEAITHHFYNALATAPVLWDAFAPY